MKRWISLILTLFLLVFAVGCAVNTPAIQVPVEYFYPYPLEDIVYNGEPTITKSELWESAGHEGELDFLLNQYFKGPKSEYLTSPFPSNLTVVNCQINEETITLELSAELSQLTGIDLTTACACITQTCLTMYPECNKVQITTGSSLLDGMRWITMTRDTMMLMDNSTAPTETTAEPQMD